MLNKGFGLVARHRGAFLAGVLVIAVPLGVVGRSLHDTRWPLLFGTMVALILGFLGLAYVAGARYHPAILLPVPGQQAFATAPNPALTFSAAAFTFLAAGLGAETIGDVVTAEEDWVFDVPVSALLLLAGAIHWYLAWHGDGVRLRPDGIHTRHAFGSLVIPWEALDVAVPLTRANLTMYYRQPELVRRRGLRPLIHRLPSGSDAGYLARVLHEYVTNPGHRPAIGTTAELTRLSATLGSATVETIRVPVWATLREGWTFLSGLPSGGMAVLGKETDEVVLLDATLAPTAAVTVPGLRSVWSLGISVSEEAGLVAACFADGPRIYDLATGAQVHALTHRNWSVPSSAAWTSGGRLLWTMVPTEKPGADELVVLDPRTWATVGRLAVRPASLNQAYYWLLPSPAGDEVGILDALADSDGFSLRWARRDGDTVGSPGAPLRDYELADVGPDGREFLAVTDGLPNELEIFDLPGGRTRDRLSLEAPAGEEEPEDSWSSEAYWLDADRLVARTEECHLLLLHRRPLRTVAQLDLAGYQYSPFDGRSVDTGATLPFLSQIRPWTGQRFVTTHRDNGTWVSRVYDLAAVELP